MRLGDTPESERWVQWQFVPPEAPLLGRRTVFGSIQWGPREATSGPGEVVGAPRIWVRGDPYPWPYGSEPCGTGPEWESGFGSDPLPELPVMPNGVPDCCTPVMPPIPVPQCPAGLPAVMWGRFENTQSPPGTLHADFALMHVPGSMPPRWEAVFDWAMLPGGSAVDLLTWSSSGSSLAQMRLVGAGCFDFDRDMAAILPPATCEEAEWWYAFNTALTCANIGSNDFLYRIRVQPF